MKKSVKRALSALLAVCVVFSAMSLTAGAQQSLDELMQLLENSTELKNYYEMIYGDLLAKQPEYTEPTTEEEPSEPEVTAPEDTEPATEPTQPMTTEPSAGAEPTEPTAEPTEPVTTEPVEETTHPCPTEPTSMNVCEETTEACETTAPPVPPEEKELIEAYNELNKAIENANKALNGSADSEEIEKAYNRLKNALATASGFHLSGDINLDGKVDVKDATLVQKCAAELAGGLTDLAFKQGDVTHDGKLTVKDATKIQKIAAQLI